MKRTMKWLVAGDPTEPWKVWLALMLLGALFGAVLSLLAPLAYTSVATVVVDLNAEETWKGSPDNEIFYYLERESRKLEELAWSDLIIQQVSSASGISTDQLRNGILELSHPKDGGWHFYATFRDPQKTQQIAEAWATTFTQAALEGATNAEKLAAIRIALAKNPADSALLQSLETSEKASHGIQAGIEVSLSQAGEVPAAPNRATSWSILGGSLIGLLVGLLASAIKPGEDR